MDSNALPAKRLLIVTGPQGSGNHVLTRVFSLHRDVSGWHQLTQQYWVPSDQEPFAEYWVYPEQLSRQTFDAADYFVANVSAPFFYDGVRQLPKIHEVAKRAQELGVDVTIAIVCRDAKINSVQQQRVGGEVTLPMAMDYYRSHLLNQFDCCFVSHETFFAWGKDYIEYLARQWNFPVDVAAIEQWLDVNPNAKYVQPVQTHWLDDVIRAGRRPFSQRKETQ